MKVGFLNSTCVWLKLVNSIENRRKLGQMQTQYFWILGEK
jgi:hypothetical protein